MQFRQALHEHDMNATSEVKLLLHVAIKNEHETILRLSLKLGADPWSAMFAGRTAYHEAFRYHKLSILRLLVKSRVDCLKIPDQDTALHFAAYLADEGIVLALLERRERFHVGPQRSQASTLRYKWPVSLL